jgi:endonuclease/exonuclease/phosphatase family metal-dependent hydrolase
VKPIKLGDIKTGLRQMIEPEEETEAMEKFCAVYRELLNNPKSVFISAHSLGTWLVAGCEILNPNNKIEGVMFSPYVANIKSPKAKFLAETSRFKKIFYNNDPVVMTLLQMPVLNNALILTPRTNPVTFVNSHSMSVFLGDISLINVDIKEYKKPIDIEKEKTKKLSTTLNLMSYNIKMLSPVVFQLLNNKRAEWIPRELARRHPSNEVIIIQELFDNMAENIFDREMRKVGYKSSEKVSENYLLQGKLQDGGIKIYSKYPIEKQKQTTYKDSSKEDKLAGKGAVNIRIRKDGIPIHIIGTHLQSGKNEKEIKNKKSQFSQLNKDLIKEGHEILIVGGDMNIARNRQRTILNEMLEDNGLKEFNYSGKNTTDTDFSESTAKWLDYFFYKPSERFDISGTIEVVKDMRIEEGYWKPKAERINYGDKALGFVQDIRESVEDFGKSIGSLFQSKKQRKKQKKKSKEKKQKEFMSKYKKVFDLSDHFPIKMLLHIKEKKLNE